MKLLDLTLNLPLGGATSGFIDVPSTAWYAPYVAAAAGAGLVQGTSASTFSPSTAKSVRIGTHGAAAERNA